MKFLTITLTVHSPHPVTGAPKSTQERFREVVGNAPPAEELGFDGFGVGGGSATSQESVDLAARHGDPRFSADVTNPIEPYDELVRYYREGWEHYDRAGAATPANA